MRFARGWAVVVGQAVLQQPWLAAISSMMAGVVTATRTAKTRRLLGISR